MRFFSITSVAILLFASISFAQVTQKSEGLCSPIITHTNGNVTVICRSESGEQVTFEEPKSLVLNGGFENDFLGWGTGYIETEYFRGRLTPFWASYVGKQDPINADIAEIRGDIDTIIRHSGRKSLKITSNIAYSNHMYGTISQRVTGLERKADYEVQLWIKGDRVSSRCFVTTDKPWKHRTAFPAGSYDWMKVSHKFNVGDANHVDLRILCDAAGTVWVDDLSLDRVF